MKRDGYLLAIAIMFAIVLLAIAFAINVNRTVRHTDAVGGTADVYTVKDSPRQTTIKVKDSQGGSYETVTDIQRAERGPAVGDN